MHFFLTPVWTLLLKLLLLLMLPLLQPLSNFFQFNAKGFIWLFAAWLMRLWHVCSNCALFAVMFFLFASFSSSLCQSRVKSFIITRPVGSAANKCKMLKIIEKVFFNSYLSHWGLKGIRCFFIRFSQRSMNTALKMKINWAYVKSKSLAYKTKWDWFEKQQNITLKWF